MATATAETKPQSYAEERGIMQVPVGLVHSLIKEAFTANVEHGTRTRLEDRITLCFIAHSGIGKTSAVRQAARDLGAKLIYILLQGHDAADIKGYPAPKTNKETGEFEYLDFVRLRQFWEMQQEAANAEGVRKKFILFLGEINRSDRPMIQTIFQIVGEGAIDDHQFPLECLVVLDMNPAQRGYHVSDFDAALTTRLHEVEVTLDPADWLKWAAKNGCHPAVLQYIETKPEALMEISNESWASAQHRRKPSNPRSWMRVSSILHAKVPGEPLGLSLQLIGGVVGPEHANAIRQRWDQQEVLINGVDVVRRYDKVRHIVIQLVEQGRVDALKDLPESIITSLKGIEWASNNARGECIIVRPEGEAEMIAGITNVGRFYLDLKKDAATKFGRALTSWTTDQPEVVELAWRKHFQEEPGIFARLCEMQTARREAHQNEIVLNPLSN